MPPETPRKGQSFQLPGSIVTFLAVAADTSDSFSLFEGRVAPQQGIPLHRHIDDEAFLVLEGTFHFQIEDQHLHLGPGGFAFVSAQKRHRYDNSSAQKEGRLLVTTLPAGSHERFFAEALEPVASASAPISTQPPDLEKLVTVGKRSPPAHVASSMSSLSRRTRDCLHFAARSTISE
jgi:quercetin dioxygenase-like cupin family protein